MSTHEIEAVESIATGLNVNACVLISIGALEFRLQPAVPKLQRRAANLLVRVDAGSIDHIPLTQFRQCLDSMSWQTFYAGPYDKHRRTE